MSVCLILSGWKELGSDSINLRTDVLCLGAGKAQFAGMLELQLESYLESRCSQNETEHV